MNLKAFRSDSDPSTKRTPYAIYNGSGSPESSVTANVGDLYLQTDTGKVWVKETGTETLAGFKSGHLMAMDQRPQRRLQTIKALRQMSQGFLFQAALKF